MPTEVVTAFGPEIASVVAENHVRKLGGGWTNDTFALGSPPHLILQRVSDHYVSDAQGLMENLVRILSHLDWKQTFSSSGGSRWFQRLCPTAAGKPYTMDDEGSVWRLFEYLPGRVPRGHVAQPAIGNIAELFGRFLDGVHDLGGPALCETVVGYRDLEQIMAALDTEFAAADRARRVDVEPIRSTIDQLHTSVATAIASLDQDTWVLRPVHNDTKLSNALLAPKGDEAVAVIDLDVAMHGYAMFDFGDLVRSANRHRLADPSAPFTIDLFDVVAERFVTGAGASLSDAEIASFPAAGPRICLELGVRYVTDHLRSKPVLRLDEDSASLSRGKENLAHAQQMLDAAAVMQGTIDRLLSLR